MIEYIHHIIDFVYTHTNKNQETIDRNAYLNNDTKNFDEYLDIFHQIFLKEKILYIRLPVILKRC